MNGVRAFAVGTLGGEEGVRGEGTVRRTCARACAKGRCAARDVAGCWLLLDWMEGAWPREE